MISNRRHFFTQLASGLIAATAPGLFLPRLIKPGWRAPRLKYLPCEFTTYESIAPALISIWENDNLKSIEYGCGVNRQGEIVCESLSKLSQGQRANIEFIYGWSISKSSPIGRILS